MTFRETLNKARENNIDILDLCIACECDNTFDFDYTQEDFEKLCKKARFVFIKSDNLTEWAVAHAINNLICEEEKTIEQVIEMDKWELIDRASYYM